MRATPWELDSVEAPGGRTWRVSRWTGFNRGWEFVRFDGPDAEARARAYHASLTGSGWATVGPQLVAALKLMEAIEEGCDCFRCTSMRDALAAAAPLLKEGQ